MGHAVMNPDEAAAALEYLDALEKWRSAQLQVKETEVNVRRTRNNFHSYAMKRAEK